VVGGAAEEAEFEEELYTAGNTVVWSRGSRAEASSVYKAFTVDTPVQQVRLSKHLSNRGYWTYLANILN